MLDCDLSAALDGSVTFAYVVRNAGETPVTCRFSDAARMEVVVTEGGAERWRSSDGQVFAQVLGEETLAPGESVTYEAEWADPPTGRYEARADLLARERSCAARVAFEVP
ncbi:BsuPI-related putative proteinase inhibitor [Halomarina ordinaria]|uniref:Intracellular proteinase inhibitor BsuPI domain-containing protein n=1 Tax=Halomarina ordinaria TaxID=3033939 RepID=A0ABD5UAB0_9EURY|nr:BsuPI-related putative proteinase inhibitor [Halomarina sp. PSRA2]